MLVSVKVVLFDSLWRLTLTSHDEIVNRGTDMYKARDRVKHHIRHNMEMCHNVGVRIGRVK
jgi:hypothetical protein